MRFDPTRCAHCGGPPRTFTSHLGLGENGRVRSQYGDYFFCSDECLSRELNRYLPDRFAVGERGKTIGDDSEYRGLLKDYENARNRCFPEGRVYSNEELTERDRLDIEERALITHFENRWADERAAAIDSAASKLFEAWDSHHGQKQREEQAEREAELRVEEQGRMAHEALIAPRPIPDFPYRFEHTHIIAGTGWGKSTLLLQQIIADLSKPDPPAIVVIDPKGTMIDKLAHLVEFDGRLRHRLRIVNPHDVNYPPALNLFEAGSRRFRTYSEEVQRQLENNTVSLYHYIFSSIATALTAKQGVAFSFIVRLMFSIPGATIHTLLKLLEENTGKHGIEASKFAPYIGRLGSTAQSFFRNHFYSQSEFGETRQQITHRLYSILQYPEFDAMFSQKLRKLDIFDCLQNRNVVLVNTAKGLLGKEGSQLFGRYLIALTLGAAFERLALPKSQWHPAYLFIDEAQEYLDEEKTQELLQQVREFNLGVTIAHQQIEGQLSEALRATLAANTSIKYAGGVSGRDAAAMARDMRCDSEFIMGQRKTATETRFACYVRGMTEHPMSVPVPLGAIDRQPRMTEAAYQDLIDENRKFVSILPHERMPFREPAPETTVLKDLSEPSELPEDKHQKPTESNASNETPEAGSTW